MIKKTLIIIVVCVAALSITQAETVAGKIKANKEALWSFVNSENHQYEIILMWAKKSPDIDLLVFVMDEVGNVVPLAAGFALTRQLVRVTLGLWSTYETIYVLLRNTGGATNYWMNFQATGSGNLWKERLTHHGDLVECATQSTENGLIMQKGMQLMYRIRGEK